MQFQREHGSDLKPKLVYPNKILPTFFSLNKQPANLVSLDSPE